MVIAVGLALFAFIAGDAWQVIQPHQSQDVGEVDGEDVSAQDYQALVEEYTEAAKIEYNVNSLPDEEISRSPTRNCRRLSMLVCIRCCSACRSAIRRRAFSTRIC